MFSLSAAARSPLVLFCLTTAFAAVKPKVIQGHEASKRLEESGTEDRLKAVYERDEFSANPFEAIWWDDSSGYSVVQKESRTGEQVKLHFNVETGEPTDRKPPEGALRNRRDQVSPDGKHRFRLDGGNLAVVDLETNEKTQLVEQKGDRDVSLRNASWSPNGRFIAFTEIDETDVKQRSMLVPSDPSYPEIRKQRFARVGETIPSLRVGIADVEGQAVRWLSIDSPPEGFYLGRMEWAGEELLVERLSRFRNTREIFLASVNGEMKRVFGETNDAWAVGSQQLILGLTWIRDGNAFVVLSEKDGWRHAFLYDRDGTERGLLTPGEYDIIDKAVVDEAGGWFYFYASPHNGTEKYLHRVPLDGSGTLERITPENQPGTHEYDFSPNAKYAFHTWSSFDSPPVVELVEIADHRVIKVVEANEPLQERAKEVVAHPTEFNELKIGDGVAMDSWLIKPREFDETKKYPVFVYVYGEPYLQTVLNKWGAGQSHFLRVVADLGYVVVSIDNRGTPAPKGAAWRRSIFGSLGPLSSEDQAAGLKELGRIRPFIDLSRVGIWGWSGGGSNTLNAMFRKPDDY
ncbi:prolyl oligopeptidase family serine peptidase, partial [Roseiconus nitratireducens]